MGCLTHERPSSRAAGLGSWQQHPPTSLAAVVLAVALLHLF